MTILIQIHIFFDGTFVCFLVGPLAPLLQSDLSEWLFLVSTSIEFINGLLYFSDLDNAHVIYVDSHTLDYCAATNCAFQASHFMRIV